MQVLAWIVLGCVFVWFFASMSLIRTPEGDRTRLLWVVLLDLATYVGGLTAAILALMVIGGGE